MADHNETYQNPLIHRYATTEMARIFSDQRRYTTWRRLWIALAKASRKAGANISGEQIAAMEAVLEDVPFARVRELEKELRHDVMAHIHAFGEQAPLARPIIHLGATSCFVTDNADLVLLRDGMRLLLQRLVNTMAALGVFAREYRECATLGFTHFQPAQPVTVGKRACLWLYDLTLDLADLERQIHDLPFRGVKGTTGTQASFLALFDNDSEKVRMVDRMVAEEMGFSLTTPVSGQTYTRKLDYRILTVLSGMAQSAGKFANDLRLLQSMGEMEEPFQSKQVGSSAMPYKRNPMRTERMTSLARFVISLTPNTAATAATQWFERTLDDSANRRIVIPEAFLAVDGIFNLYQNVAGNMVVHTGMINRHLDLWLPFMLSENLLMEGVRQGGDRQDLHERIRQHARRAADKIHEGALENELLDYIREDSAFSGIKTDEAFTDAKKLTGRAAVQVDEFLASEINPILERLSGFLGGEATVEV